jgi:hypothetical protein
MNLTQNGHVNWLFRIRYSCRLFWTWTWDLIRTYATSTDVAVRTCIAASRQQNSWWHTKQCGSLCCPSSCLQSRLPFSASRPNERKTWFSKKKHEQPPSVPAPNSSFTGTLSLEQRLGASRGRKTLPAVAATRRTLQREGTFHKEIMTWIF